jgi:hypothetical protein
MCERKLMILIAGSQTQIDEPRVVAYRDLDRPHERSRSGRELPIEDLDHENVGIRRLFSNDGRDGSAMSQTVDIVIVLAAVAIDADATVDALYMGMRDVHAAVDDSHAHAAPGRVGEVGKTE